ncbi:MAG: hypothetical protein NZM25_05595 [Leptospiraceae bacterium]|nr:hypothetical protein [Leptospiraceae bacterium]MDW8306520.1 hypothetical protein [Leptospiraceae bacterium]
MRYFFIFLFQTLALLAKDKTLYLVPGLEGCLLYQSQDLSPFVSRARRSAAMEYYFKEKTIAFAAPELRVVMEIHNKKEILPQLSWALSLRFSITQWQNERIYYGTERFYWPSAPHASLTSAEFPLREKVLLEKESYFFYSHLFYSLGWLGRPWVEPYVGLSLGGGLLYQQGSYELRSERSVFQAGPHSGFYTVDARALWQEESPLSVEMQIFVENRFSLVNLPLRLRMGAGLLPAQRLVLSHAYLRLLGNGNPLFTHVSSENAVYAVTRPSYFFIFLGTELSFGAAH